MCSGRKSRRLTLSTKLVPRCFINSAIRLIGGRSGRGHCRSIFLKISTKSLQLPRNFHTLFWRTKPYSLRSCRSSSVTFFVIIFGRELLRIFFRTHKIKAQKTSGIISEHFL